MGRRHFIEGHAIVSADDRIADATGVTPAALRNDADWRRFQSILDRAAVSVLGRLGHEANPNRLKRNRLILSSSAHGVERRSDGWWWNPGQASLVEALDAAAPEGGLVAVTGGRQVFDLFLDLGYDGFDLARAPNVWIGGEGIKVFSACSAERSADALLAATGMIAAPSELLDAEAHVRLTRWRRPA